jgi:hypothetical protein
MTDHTVEGATGVYRSEPAVTCSFFTLRSAQCAATACSLPRSGPKSTRLTG